MLNIFFKSLIFKFLLLSSVFLVSSCGSSFLKETKNLILDEDNIECPEISFLPHAYEIIKLDKLKKHTSLKEIYDSYLYYADFDKISYNCTSKINENKNIATLNISFDISILIKKGPFFNSNAINNISYFIVIADNESNIISKSTISRDIKSKDNFIVITDNDLNISSDISLESYLTTSSIYIGFQMTKLELDLMRYKNKNK